MQAAGIGVEESRVKADRSGGNDRECRVEQHKPQKQKPRRKSLRGVVEPSCERPAERPAFGLEVGRHVHDAMTRGLRLGWRSLSLLAKEHVKE
jgi:hypothetical protein